MTPGTSRPCTSLQPASSNANLRGNGDDTALQAVSILPRFQPSTLYRFVSGLAGVAATVGFVLSMRFNTPNYRKPLESGV